MHTSANYPYEYKGESWSSHRIIADWLSTFSAGTRVLDIGAATGMLGKACAGKGFVMDGIEPNAEWAGLARPYYHNLKNAPVEKALAESLHSYDVIVFADVLEHLMNPEDVLRQLMQVQPEQCLFLISVPNVANLWVRVNLLLGRFEYQDRGILDRTHLHFFTWRSLKGMLTSLGLEIHKSAVTPIPLSLVNSFYRDNRIGRLAGRYLNCLTQAMPSVAGISICCDGSKRPKQQRR